MYKEHSSFTPPQPYATLWRYVTFAKFVDMIDKRALFFARADKLGDPFEGSYPKANVKSRNQNNLGPDESKTVINFQKHLPRFILISCWHENEYESEAMWKLYSMLSDGIAIKTDFTALTKCFTSEKVIHIGKVNYLDYPIDSMPEAEFFDPFLHKRRPFEHETEVRAMTHKMPEPDGTTDIRDVMCNSPDICNVGVSYAADLSILISEIIVAPLAPEGFVDLVKSVSSRYHLGAPVTRSSLAGHPILG